MIVLLIGPDYTAYFSSDQWESKVMNSHSTSDSQDMSCCGWDFGWSIQCSQFSYGHTHTHTHTQTQQTHALANKEEKEEEIVNGCEWTRWRKKEKEG